MATTRICLEIGSGGAFRGGNRTEAILRAIEDSTHYGWMTLCGSLQIDPDTVKVAVGRRSSGRADIVAVRAAIPNGQMAVSIVRGRLEVDVGGGRDAAVIASDAAPRRLQAAQLCR